MRVPLLFSVTFHVAIFLLALFGLPSRDPELVEDYRVIDVEVISETQAPEPRPVPKEKQEARPEPKPQPPVPPPPPPPEQQAALKPEPEPPQKEEPTPEPAPEAVPIPDPKPKPAPPKPVEEQPKKPEKPKPAAKAPRPKPKPKPDFNTMMLKTVQKLKEAPPPKEEPKEKEKEKEKSFDERMAALMNRDVPQRQEEAQKAPLGESLSISEIDAIRRQIERCWLVPTTIGAKDVERMIVEIGLTLNPDGTLRSARIVDQFRFETDPTYRAVAETAVRAVRNPKCNKFNLPLEKYEIWKDMTMTFNPSEMVGR